MNRSCRKEIDIQVDVASAEPESLEPPLTAARIRPSKRALDIVTAGALLIATSPLLAVIAALVRRDGGPIFFRQLRLGTGGRLFEVRKFRSMVLNAEDRLSADPELYARYVANGYKLPPGEDDRLTKWGDILRSSHLDELPQLISVLKGDMSMVGPRPIMVLELDEYRSRGAADMYLAARPGLTGAWQIEAHERPSYDDRIAIECSYAARATARTDAWVIVQTAVVIVRDVSHAAQRRRARRSSV